MRGSAHGQQHAELDEQMGEIDEPAH